MTYKLKTSVDFGGDTPTAEFDIEVSYTVAWGTPEHNPGPGAPPELYDPGNPSIVEDLKLLKVEGKDRPWSEHSYGFMTDEDFEELILGQLDEDYLITMAGEIEESRRPD